MDQPGPDAKVVGMLRQPCGPATPGVNVVDDGWHANMAALEQLAAGVAHEINNPIAFVSANLGTLKSYFDDVFARLSNEADGEAARLDPGQVALSLGEIKADADDLMAETREGLLRVKRIVEDLREFASLGGSDWHRVDLHGGMDATINLLQGQAANIAIGREYGAIPEVECLPSEINRVFMNLLLNATDAIDGHGTITVRTRADDDGVWIEVADTGCGIRPENVSRVFDPFFTTKPNGRRLGLGLSLAYGIVQRHHGRIDVASTPGAGSTFRFWLPCRQPADAGDSMAKAPST